MLGTFAIGLREGLEATLIVAIVGGFLIRRGDRAAVRSMWIGVGFAVVICVVVAVVVRLVLGGLDQQSQEGLETVIGLIAVAMITYMILWMRRHARDMRGELEQAASDALAKGSSWALIAMAFLAVLREGIETTALTLAAFVQSSSPVTIGGGLVLGVAVAVLLGWGIYRGSVRLNLSRFFTVTAVFLVVVAAGLLAGAAHTAHEATWLNVGQTQVADLSAVVRPGTPIESLLTGMFGLLPYPVLVEVVVWLVYLVPMLVFVVWPQRRPARRAPAPAAASV